MLKFKILDYNTLEFKTLDYNTHNLKRCAVNKTFATKYLIFSTWVGGFWLLISANKYLSTNSWSKL